MKIFHIGFHKTGTSTYEEVYKKLGYSLFDRLDFTGPFAEKLRLYKHERDIEYLTEIIEAHDAFADNPWFWHIYQELDERYPDAKFVFTIRPTEDWFASLNGGHVNMQEIVSQQLYEGRKPTLDNADYFKDVYETYNANVLKYFEGKDNFIQIDISQNPQWDEICSFLGKPIPDESFPWKNRGKR